MDLAEWFRWQNDRRLQLPPDLLDEVSVPREVDIWLRKSIEKKAAKASEYKRAVAAHETWLVVHGGTHKAYDFFNLQDDEHYDIPLLIKEAHRLRHPFQRIYVASASRDRVVCVYPNNAPLALAPDITNPALLKVLTVRSFLITTIRGVNRIPVGREYEPYRRRALPLLDPDRIKRLG